MLKIAGIQYHCSDDKRENLKQALTLAKIACDKGAKIICFPQLFNLPWFPREINADHFALAENLVQETITALSEFAEQERIILICPVFEKTQNSRYFNSAVLINHDGNILGQYRKVHIPDLPLWKERFYFEAGDLGFPVFKTDYADIGIQLCWDTFFPEGFRILALKGAQIVFCPTASAYATQQRWKKVAYGHAITNNLFIMRVNRVGQEKKQTFYGNSFCVDPHGNLLEETGDANQSILVCSVDLEEINKLRQNWTFFENRQPALYGEITKTTA